MMNVRRSTTYSAILIAALALSIGCMRRSAIERLHEQAPTEYRGHYTRSSDGSWFRPCGTNSQAEAWWVTVTDRAVAQVDSARAASQLVEGQPSFVRWLGVFTRGGEIGPAGRGAVLVRDVLEIRPARGTDCS